MKILGIDASYTRTGLSIAEDGTLLAVRSIKFKGCKTKTEKRAQLIQKLERYIKKYNPDYIIIERTRQFSTSGREFIAMNMIKTGVSLLTAVIDTAYRLDKIPVYSVDTRSWMKQITGTAKNSNKRDAINFVESLGFTVYDDDDAADSACIALYGFIDEKLKKLKLEE